MICCGLVRNKHVVRATMMRGTLHLVGAKDYLRLRTAIQPVLTKGMRAVLRDRIAGLDVDDARRRGARVLSRATANVW